MKKNIVILLVILTSLQVKAQVVKKRAIDASIGYGMSIPYDDINIAGTGLYLQGEYVLTVSKWFDVRPYAGMILTKSNGKDINQNPTIYKSTSNAYLFGGKGRVILPIPYVSPYIEVGIGASIGSFKTFTPYTNINSNGLKLHIPFSVGLELGKEHNVDLGILYYVHPAVEQVTGAVAIGISIPLKK